MSSIGLRSSYLSHALYKRATHPQFLAPTGLLHRQFHQLFAMSSPLKRKAGAVAATKSKKPKISVPEYHLTPSRQDESGSIVWPAPEDQIERARAMIQEWYVIWLFDSPNIFGSIGSVTHLSQCKS